MRDESACWRDVSILPLCPYSYCKISLFLFFFPCCFLTPPYPFISEQAMAIQTQIIPLTALDARSEVVSEPDLIPAPALPPISRRKQAAVLCSAFAAIALTIGYNQCFGVFQEYYLSSSQDVLVPSPASQVSPPTALLAFVGSLCYGLTWAGGILVNPVISRIEHGNWTSTTPSTRLWRRRILRLLAPRTITISGVLMVSAGFMLASVSSSVWQLLLTQGLLVGFGMSLLYFPFLAPAPEFFTSHRATAMGFVSFPSAIAFFPFQVGVIDFMSYCPERKLYFSCLDNAVLPLKFSRDINFTVHLLDPSRWRHRRSHTLTRHPGATQLRRWSLDSQALCRLQPDRRVTNRLGGATESICYKFDRRRPGEAKYPRLTRFSFKTDVPLFCCGRVFPGLCSRSLCLVFLVERCQL